MEKIKILYLLSSNKYSGAENVVCTIIKNMPKNIECLYCSPDGSISNHLIENNIKFYPLKKMSYKEINKAIKKFNPSIIHAHDYKASCYAALFSKNCKIISHIHGNNEKMRKKNWETFLYKILSKKFKKIIWVSDSCLNDFYYKENVISKSIVLSNVIDKKVVERKSKIYDFKEKFDFIFLGRLSSQKNPERFIEICKLIKAKKHNFKAAIVGDGNKKTIIEEQIKMYNLSDNIKLYGFVSNPYPILLNSKILVMTSNWEGTPMVALEALALAKPIVSTPVDGLKKIIKNDENGFLSENNTELVKKIIEYIDNYEMVANNVKISFKKINNAENYFKQIERMYE